MSALSCTIADIELAFDSMDTPVPVPGVLITAVPALPGAIFQLDDAGHHLMDVSAGRSVMTQLETGQWQIVLPGPTFTSPTACPWIITLSDGRGFAGTVPDEAGPFSMFDLIHDHQWAQLALPTSGVSGPRGVPGPPGVSPTGAVTSFVVFEDAEPPTRAIRLGIGDATDLQAGGSSMLISITDDVGFTGHQHVFLLLDPVFDKITAFTTVCAEVADTLDLGEEVRPWRRVYTMNLWLGATPTTTAPAVGSAGALPGPPAGYVTMDIGGSPALVPFWRPT